FGRCGTSRWVPIRRAAEPSRSSAKSSAAFSATEFRQRVPPELARRTSDSYHCRVGVERLAPERSDHGATPSARTRGNAAGSEQFLLLNGRSSRILGKKYLSRYCRHTARTAKTRRRPMSVPVFLFEMRPE